MSSPIEAYKIIGIIGSRQRDTEEDYSLVFAELKKIWEKDISIICSGGCGKGGDRFAKSIASVYDLPYLEFPARWGEYGRKAGFIRNSQIAEACHYLIACRAEGGSRGTDDTIEKFRAINGESRLIIV